MKDLNEITDSLSSVEKNLMYFKLQKELNKEPEYIIKETIDGYYYIESKFKKLNTCIFEKPEYAKLAYSIASSLKDSESLIVTIKYVFRLLNIDSEWTK